MIPHVILILDGLIDALKERAVVVPDVFVLPFVEAVHHEHAHIIVNSANRGELKDLFDLNFVKRP